MGLFLKGTHGTNRQNKDFCFLPNVLGPVQLLYLSYIFILGYLRVLFVREKNNAVTLCMQLKGQKIHNKICIHFFLIT